MKNADVKQVKIQDGFWRFYMDLNKTEVIKHVYERFKETGRFDALKCHWREGMPNKPHIFWDSDVAKWIEGVAYILEEGPAPLWEDIVDAMIEDMEENRRKDGYFNSYFVSADPSKIFTVRDWHELYCLGHMIEAAIAYHKATGKDRLLNGVLQNVDMVYRVFVEEKSANFVTPGHEEIELALLKLYDYLGNKKHLELARFFLEQRGNNEIEKKNEYDQSNIPVRQITEAIGHAVRAGYLYAAMCMLAKVDADPELMAVCQGVFHDIVARKMAITGGVGANGDGERFSYAYNLPNSDTYNETCAAISLALFAAEMQEGAPNGHYADVIERVLYNGFLSGLSLDGEKFFYTNPLEIDRKKYAHNTYLPICERVKVFSCSCCPPNVVRTLSSLPRYLYTLDGDHIYCNQFATGEAHLTVKGKDAVIKQRTAYPCDGKITIEYEGEPTTLFVRVPEWCIEYTGARENGYARFALSGNDKIEIEFPMELHFIEANPKVQDNAGRFAVQRGPLVYCMEGIDNGENLRDIRLLENSTVEVVKEEGVPAPVLYMPAQRRVPTDELYFPKSNRYTDFTARLIPYFAFANREASDMIVWTMVQSPNNR